MGAAKFVQREIGDDKSLAFLVKAANDLTAAANKIQVAVSRAMADEDGSKLGNSRKARKAIAAEVAIASTSVNAASERAHNAIVMLTAKTDPKTAEDFSIAMMHQEVRSALLRMSDAERRKAIATAISSGDDVCRRDVGLTDVEWHDGTEQTVAREQWRKKRHADVRARIDRLRKGVGQLDRLVPMFNQWAGGLVAEPAPDAAGRRRRARLSVSLGAQPGRSRVSMAVPAGGAWRARGDASADLALLKARRRALQKCPALYLFRGRWRVGLGAETCPPSFLPFLRVARRSHQRA